MKTGLSTSVCVCERETEWEREEEVFILFILDIVQDFVKWFNCSEWSRQSAVDVQGVNQVRQG